MTLEHSKKELKHARESLELMKNSKTMDEFERNWKKFLNHIEKNWKKTERECQDFKKKFEPWQGSFTRKRRIDPLLIYLKQARDADEHTINEIVERKHSSMSIKQAHNNRTHFIKKMVIKNGKLETYEGDPIRIEFTPGRVRAIAFTNRNKIFSIPTVHEGMPIKDNDNPIELAKLGLKFYTDYLKQAEEKFFK